jgi:hypothetical protein
MYWQIMTNRKLYCFEDLQLNYTSDSTTEDARQMRSGHRNGPLLAEVLTHQEIVFERRHNPV